MTVCKVPFEAIVSLGKGDGNAKMERGGLGTTTSIGAHAVVKKFVWEFQNGNVKIFGEKNKWLPWKKQLVRSV